MGDLVGVPRAVNLEERRLGAQSEADPVRRDVRHSEDPREPQRVEARAFHVRAERGPVGDVHADDVRLRVLHPEEGQADAPVRVQLAREGQAHPEVAGLCRVDDVRGRVGRREGDVVAEDHGRGDEHGERSHPVPESPHRDVGRRDGVEAGDAEGDVRVVDVERRLVLDREAHVDRAAHGDPPRLQLGEARRVVVDGARVVGPAHAGIAEERLGLAERDEVRVAVVGARGEGGAREHETRDQRESRGSGPAHVHPPMKTQAASPRARHARRSRYTSLAPTSSKSRFVYQASRMHVASSSEPHPASVA